MTKLLGKYYADRTWACERRETVVAVAMDTLFVSGADAAGAAGRNEKFSRRRYVYTASRRHDGITALPALWAAASKYAEYGSVRLRITIRRNLVANSSEPKAGTMSVEFKWSRDTEISQDIFKATISKPGHK